MPSPRKILLCVSGMSPAIITETLYALVTQTPPFIPDEIHVSTTQEGRDKILNVLLPPLDGQFHRLMADYLPDTQIRFDHTTIHVITQEGPENAALKDIVTEADNKAAGDSIYRVMRQLKDECPTQLHVSIAGGRKSMSFYAGHAFSLIADQRDTLSHVLVNEPFDNPSLRFYFPPATPVQLTGNNRGQELRATTAEATVMLAELSVLRLGTLFANNWPPKARASFDFAVTLAQDTLVPPVMDIWIDEKYRGWLRVSGQEIKLSPQQFMVFAVYALARKHADSLPENGLFSLNDLPNDFWIGISNHLAGIEISQTSPKMKGDVIRSKINAELKLHIGPVATHFQIESIGGKRLQNKPASINASPDSFNIDLPPRWLSLLEEFL